MGQADSHQPESCKVEVRSEQSHREEIPVIVRQLVETCHSGACFEHVGPEPIPSRDAAIDLIHRAFRLLYPGYFSRRQVDAVNLDYYLGQEAVGFFEVPGPADHPFLRHECLRYGLPCIHCQERGQEEALGFHAGAPPAAQGHPGRMSGPRMTATRRPRATTKSSSATPASSP
jgi:serine O-acetyltransferase